MALFNASPDVALLCIQRPPYPVLESLLSKYGIKDPPFLVPPFSYTPNRTLLSSCPRNTKLGHPFFLLLNINSQSYSTIQFLFPCILRSP